MALFSTTLDSIWWHIQNTRKAYADSYCMTHSKFKFKYKFKVLLSSTGHREGQLFGIWQPTDKRKTHKSTVINHIQVYTITHYLFFFSETPPSFLLMYRTVCSAPSTSWDNMAPNLPCTSLQNKGKGKVRRMQYLVPTNNNLELVICLLTWFDPKNGLRCNFSEISPMIIAKKCLPLFFGSWVSDLCNCCHHITWKQSVSGSQVEAKIPYILSNHTILHVSCESHCTLFAVKYHCDAPVSVGHIDYPHVKHVSVFLPNHLFILLGNW